MNQTDFLPVYAYIGAIFVCLAVIIITSHGLNDSDGRVLPDITLSGELNRLAVSADPEGQIQMLDHHSVGTPVMIDTDFVIPSRVKVMNDLIVKGRVAIGDGARLHGSVKASDSIKLGREVLIEGNLVSDSDISVGSGAEVLGALHAKDDIWLMSSSSVSLSVVSTGTIYIHEGARVGKKISASRGIVYQALEHTPQPTEETPATYVQTADQFSEPTCFKCRSLLLIFDPLSLHWRCLNCGSYQPANGSLQYRNFQLMQERM